MLTVAPKPLAASTQAIITTTATGRDDLNFLINPVPVPGLNICYPATSLPVDRRRGIVTCNSLDIKRVGVFFARRNAPLRKQTATYLKHLDVTTYTRVAGVQRPFVTRFAVTPPVPAACAKLFSPLAITARHAEAVLKLTQFAPGP